jgi:hypothetical protein
VPEGAACAASKKDGEFASPAGGAQDQTLKLTLPRKSVATSRRSLYAALIRPA